MCVFEVIKLLLGGDLVLWIVDVEWFEIVVDEMFVSVCVMVFN